MLEVFDPPYVQRALVEVALLAIAAGTLGTWIVLRGLSFYAHAVGTAAFPGLVLADGVGFSPLLGAVGTAAVVAAAVGLLSRRQPDAYDSLTALALVGALAAGVLLASDVFHSQGSVERLLFGSLLLVDFTDQVATAAVAVAAVVGGALLGRRWLAVGLDPEGARALGVRSLLSDLVLLGLIAAAAVSALDAIGALLATAMLVVPAATSRLFCDRMRTWQLATVGTALAQGIVGLYLSVSLNAPPGATIAVLGGAVFVVAVAVRALPKGAAALALLALAGCGGAEAGSGGKLRVVATTTQVADITRAVGGPAVEVTQILHPNSDPHDYEPRPDDITAAAQADVVVTSGDGIDAWIDEVVANAGGDAAVVDAGEGRPRVLPSGQDREELDPHWWHDPRNVEYAAGRIRDALVKAEPSARATIEKSAATYVAKVNALEAGIAGCMERVAAGRRKLVTDHDAFGYFADRFDVEVVGAVIPSQTTQAQPSAGDLAELADLIRAERVKAVFPESSLDPGLARAIAEQTGATADYTLYADTLGPRGSRGATYLASEAANADAIVRGFTGGRRGCSISGI